MLSSEQVLENAARDGSLDIAEWPRVLEGILQKLHNIVHHDFPLPAVPLPAPLPSTIDLDVVASTPPIASTDERDAKDGELPSASEEENDFPPNSQSSTKENDAPAHIATSRPPVPGFEATHSSRQSSRPIDNIELQSGALPPDLLSSYNASTHILERDFASSPPYTIQRLAELVLRPKRHYRFLPAYLRALDRVVSVSSPTTEFLPTAAHSTTNGSFLVNGNSQINGLAEREGLGSDESLGGALLTPIPWLSTTTLASAAAASHPGDVELHSESTETIDGPRGAGSIETVTVTVNGMPSVSSVAHTTPVPAPSLGPTPTSPTLSEQSDASSSSSSGGAATDALLREQGAVTQGELLRQEQEAGIVPLSQGTSPRRTLIAGGATVIGRESMGSGPPLLDDISDDLPHARGPDVITMEDTGPQPIGPSHGLDLEAAVGRSRSKSPQPPLIVAPAPEAELEAEAAANDNSGAPGRLPADVEKDVEKLKAVLDKAREQEAKAMGDDVIVADADGRDVEMSDQEEVTGDLGGADAVDTTTL